LKVNRWLASVLGLYTQANATWTDLSSATENKSTGESAIANLETRVDALEDGLLASASLETLVQNKVNEVTAASGFVTTSTLNDTLGGYTTSTQYASLQGRVSDTETALANAQAGLQLAVKYTDSTKTRVESSAKLWANQIEIDAQHQLDLSAQEININAEDINLNGETWAQYIGVGEIVADTLTAGNATFNGTVIATDGEIGGFSISSDELSNNNYNASISISNSNNT
jgi:hypothetical protein